MAKRFTDTEIWKKVWFRKLTPAQKCFVRYLWDDCNIAGIWEVDLEKAVFFIGEDIGNPVTFLPNDFKIVEFDGGKKWFLPKFIKFQYPGGIDSNKRMFISIKNILTDYGLIDQLLIADESSIDQRSMQDMDKDKDKDKVKDKDKEKEVKKKHGEYKNILLSDSEFEKLGKEYPDYLEAIEFLSRAKEMKGYKYKSDYLALKKWVFDALKEHKAKHGGKSIMPEMQATFEETMRRYGGKQD